MSCRRVILIISLIFILDLVNGFIHSSILKQQGRSFSNLGEKKSGLILQPLDHFDRINENRTFTIKYTEQVNFWKPNGPIYVYVEPEDIYLLDFDYSDSLMSEMANATNGVLFSIQQRYYGAASYPHIPVYNITEYYKFLSTKQVIEDTVHFINYLKTVPQYRGSKVVVMGTGIAGNIAAWTRALHPETVDAAVAISAPVQAKKDFHEYFDGLRYTYETYGTKDCLQHITNKLKTIEELLKSEEGIAILKKELNIWDESDLTTPEHIQYLFYLIYQIYYGSHATYGTPDTIQEVCRNYDHIDFGQSCAVTIDGIHIGPSEYQSCTEFGHLATTSSEKEPFARWNPSEFFLNACLAFFEGDVEKRVDEGVARTNEMFGGRNPNVTRVVYTYGDMDPWSRLGVAQDLGPEAPVLMAKGTSRGTILEGSDDDDPPALTEQRKRVMEHIMKWISDA